MSYFHSESRNPGSQLTVRVKFLNLTQASTPVQSSPQNPVAEERPGTMLSPAGHLQEAVVGQLIEGLTEEEDSTCSVTSPKPPEICFEDDGKIAGGGLEEHIETCAICANRVELQLEFMECIETAVYQRLAEPWNKKLHGALMVSAPKFNFAICGELEVTNFI